jgi:hypothetical protein
MLLTAAANRVVVPARQTTQPGGIGSWESILGFIKSLKIRALASWFDNPVPTRFLTPIDCFKIPALESITYCAGLFLCSLAVSGFLCVLCTFPDTDLI